MVNAPSQNPDDEEQLDALLAAYLQQADENPSFDRNHFLNAHPQFADDLGELLEAEALIEKIAGPRLDQLPEGDPDRTLLLDSHPTVGVDSREPPFEPPAPTLPVSTRANIREFGDYVLLELIGRGGMGVVYLAQQKSLDRLVAIKMIKRSSEATDDDIRRFIREAQAAARLQHPHIVDVFEIGEIDGEHFFSMEFVPGQDLSQTQLQQDLSSRQIAEHVKTVAWAIEHAHRNQIVHRDLKPANIIIDEYGQPRVTDFGLAKDTRRTQQLARKGVSVGTPAYMSPEQATADDESVGPASDVYSLGAVLYCLLAKQPPFRSPTALDTLKQVIHEEPVRPSDLDPTVDRRLEAICMKCLRKDPQDRYASAADLADDLDRYLRDQPLQAVPANGLARVIHWFREVPLIAAFSGRPVQSSSLGHRLFQFFVPVALLLGLFLLRTQGCPQATSVNTPPVPEASTSVTP